MDFSGPPRLTKARSMWSPSTNHSKSPKLELSFLLNNQTDFKPSSRATSSTRKENEATNKKKERKFTCDQCPAAFTQSHDLSKHIWAVHEKLRPFKCQVCEKTFGERGNLTKHIRSVHMNDRPYSCEFCTASFAFKDGLQRHRRSVHSSSRRFKCENCGVAFNQAYQLRRHSCEMNALK